MNSALIPLFKNNKKNRIKRIILFLTTKMIALAFLSGDNVSPKSQPIEPLVDMASPPPCMGV